MNSRRKILVASGVSALCTPFAALAQQSGKMRRVIFFYGGSRQSAIETGRYPAFIEGMRKLGYEEGKNLVIETRFADGDWDSVGLVKLTDEVIATKPEVIVATGTPVYRALQRATTNIPVVITLSADPVGEGFTRSLARPTGNFTGMSTGNTDVFPKQIELLSTLVPKLSKLSVLWNPSNDSHAGRLKHVSVESQKAGIKATGVEARTADEIERGFAALARERTGAMLILTDTFFFQQMPQIAQLALKHRLPSIFATRQYAEVGGLMTYGQNITDNFGHAAVYVDKLLKGAKPGDIPIEQPTKYEFVLNMKTAKAIGVKIPGTILMRTDKVIE
jgi:putative ABC transport system substrate-binding protein